MIDPVFWPRCEDSARLPWLIWAIVVGLAISLVVYATRADAEPVRFDCQQFAVGIGLAVDFRDTGAQLDKVLTLARKRNGDVSVAHREAIEREIRRAWSEGRSRERAVFDVFKRCQQQMGDMGREG